MVVQSAHRSLSCWPAARVCTRAWGFYQSWGAGPRLLAEAEMGGGTRGSFPGPVGLEVGVFLLGDHSLTCSTHWCLWPLCLYSLLSPGGSWGRWWRVMRWVLWEPSPVGGCSGDISCPQFSHLLAGCCGLHQRSGIPPHLPAGPSCLAGAEMGSGHRMCPGP